MSSNRRNPVTNWVENDLAQGEDSSLRRFGGASLRFLCRMAVVVGVDVAIVAMAMRPEVLNLWVQLLLFVTVFAIFGGGLLGQNAPGKSAGNFLTQLIGAVVSGIFAFHTWGLFGSSKKKRKREDD